MVFSTGQIIITGVYVAGFIQVWIRIAKDEMMGSSSRWKPVRTAQFRRQDFYAPEFNRSRSEAEKQAEGWGHLREESCPAETAEKASRDRGQTHLGEISPRTRKKKVKWPFSNGLWRGIVVNGSFLLEVSLHLTWEPREFTLESGRSSRICLHSAGNTLLRFVIKRLYIVNLLRFVN